MRCQVELLRWNNCLVSRLLGEPDRDVKVVKR
jgi:hypothetical protein